MSDVGADAGRAVARLAKQVERALVDADLSLPQYRALLYLSIGGSAASLLAGQLGVSRPSITALVDGLVARGLVERERDPDDRRRVRHALTTRGADALQDADTAVDQRLAEILQELPASERRRAVEGLELWGEALTAARERALAARP